MDSSVLSILAIIFIIIGLISNPIVLYILTRPKFLAESIFRYFFITVIIDSLNLVGYCLLAFPIIFKSHPPALFCQITEYIGFVLLSFESFINTLNSFDRLFSVKYLRKFLWRKKFQYQAFLVILLFTIASLCNVPYIIYFNESDHATCGIISEFKNSSFIYHFSAIVIFTIFVPFTIQIFNTIINVHHMIKNKQRLNETQRNFKREKQYFKNVFIMDFWFFVCYLPMNTLQIIIKKLAIDNVTYGWMQDVYNLFAFLALIKASSNVFIFLFCNSLFRQYFISIFNCCKKKLVVISNEIQLNIVIE
jgi:hypothetical protein